MFRMKLVWMMQFQKQTKNHWLALRADGSKTSKWHMSAAFTLHYIQMSTAVQVKIWSMGGCIQLAENKAWSQGVLPKKKWLLQMILLDPRFGQENSSKHKDTILQTMFLSKIMKAQCCWNKMDARMPENVPVKDQIFLRDRSSWKEESNYQILPNWSSNWWLYDRITSRKQLKTLQQMIMNLSNAAQHSGIFESSLGQCHCCSDYWRM